MLWKTLIILLAIAFTADAQVYDALGFVTNKAEIKRFAYHVRIGFAANEKDKPNWVGGGSLLTEKWVLTCAHIFTFEEKVIKLHAIHPDYYKNKITRSAKLPAIPHREWNKETMENDIALVQLKRKLDEDGIAYVNLPQSIKGREGYQDIKKGEMFQFCGHGKTSTGENAQDPINLYYGESYVLNFARCENLNESASLFQSEATQICAGLKDEIAEDGLSGGSWGDSGAGMVVQKGDDFYIYGVLSYSLSIEGEPPATYYTPDVYTRVTSYIGWINDHVEESVDNNKKRKSVGGGSGQTKKRKTKSGVNFFLAVFSTLSWIFSLRLALSF